MSRARPSSPTRLESPSTSSIRVCANLPIWGDAIQEHGLAALVGAARDAGIDGLWVGDHVALARNDTSVYPGNESGQFFLSPDAPWYEALTTLGYIAAHSGTLDLGLAVALPVLRPPVLFAKQLATLSRLSGGSLSVGVGTGWLRPEYEAVGVPWSERGVRLDDCIDVIRECWRGEPRPGSYGAYAIPPGLTSYPTPRTQVPILVGGGSDAALRRAARVGDGWIAAAQQWDGAVEVLADQLSRLRQLWSAELPARPDNAQLAVVIPVPGEVARRPNFSRAFDERIDELFALGFRTIIVGFSWKRLTEAREMLGRLADTSKRLRGLNSNERVTHA